MTDLFPELGPTVAPEPVVKLTEALVLGLLERRFGTVSQGTGRRYVTARHVRDAAGFDAFRTFDFVAVDTWPSSGLELHVVEVKVSRSDWLRELKQPEKTQAAVDLADRFWIAAPAGVVRKDELQGPWGLLEVRGTQQLVCARRALRVTSHDRWLPPPWTRSFAVALLRASVARPVVADER